MEMFKVTKVCEVKEIMDQNFSSYDLPSETIDILNAQGRILSKDIYALENVPHFRRSTVDGYAVVSADTFGASETLPAFINLIGDAHMGEHNQSHLCSDKCMYVPTGGMLPEGADAVVMIEYVEKFQDEIAIHKSVAPKENVMDIGDDIKQDQLLFTRGTKIKAHHLGVLASVGITDVDVFVKPKICILSTGDELIDPKEDLKPGVIRDINTYTLSGLCTELGCDVIEKKVVKDDFNNLKDTLKSFIDKSDLVLLSGGSSVGTKDMTPDVINALGSPGVLIHGIAMKPGKPTIIAKINNKAVLGLPGQPASCIMAFRVLGEYLIKNLLHLNTHEELFLEGVCSTNIHASPGRETYQMVTIEESSDGYIINPVHGKSGMITLISRAQGYIKIPMNKEGISVGEKVKVYLF
ncbi:molybdopterin molybdotransferase MoeA [Anaeromicrobium sediminis]|uniref:Molybdopterin molybdenumtransferase n=1 Tax=Anaeromicrobium sediminis TaxID=1478221 RepID=A0A267MLX2_9FIRM|nr:gephyrin-like molybdotransferase Glp [Anaeromicrobium sediminis]PAB59875.1 hypothetical protein CCE28_07935 [Anaeromicrobium sediminis]